MKNDGTSLYYGMIAVVLVIMAAAWLFGSYQEASTFNKFREPGTPEATIVDAMFSELRVEAR